MAFQYPLEIPGVNTNIFLKTSLNSILKAKGDKELDSLAFLKLVREKSFELGIDEKMLSRQLNVGFSGGEKKKNEILQMKILNPKFTILDETDSGLDIDALKVIAKGVNSSRDEKILSRQLNVGFSGGEKKKNEILQMKILEPNLIILDETDSGLDIDALKIVAKGVNTLRNSKKSFLVITHYQRLLDYIKPDFVHVLSDGKIIKTGHGDLAQELEKTGYTKLN